jgi:drug/metabolite transporter (DMT)-like permease
MFAGKRLPLKALAGLLLGFGGICIIFYEHLKDLLNADFRFGIFISIIATIGWAFGTLFTKQQASNFNPYFSLGFQMLISGITFSIISYASGNVISISQIPAASWWSIAYLVVFGSGITFIAYVYSLQHLPAALASVYAYVNPVIAVLLGAAILHEKLSILIAAGGIITFTGVYLINNSLNKKIILTPEKIKK